MFNKSILRILKYMILVGSLFMIGGCIWSGRSQTPSDFSDNRIECDDIRPQVCAQNYDPVCGELSDGSRLTYSNSCSACSDHNVFHYRPGPCE